MKAQIKNYKVSAVYTGNKPAEWGVNVENWNHYNITITNTETGRRARFDFWASIAHPELETEYDVINAFRGLVEDAIGGDMQFEEFCTAYGYTNDIHKAHKAWKSRQRSAEKMHRIGCPMYDLINSMDGYA